MDIRNFFGPPSAKKKPKASAKTAKSAAASSSASTPTGKNGKKNEKESSTPRTKPKSNSAPSSASHKKMEQSSKPSSASNSIKLENDDPETAVIDVDMKTTKSNGGGTKKEPMRQVTESPVEEAPKSSPLSLSKEGGSKKKRRKIIIESDEDDDDSDVTRDDDEDFKPQEEKDEEDDDVVMSPPETKANPSSPKRNGKAAKQSKRKKEESEVASPSSPKKRSRTSPKPKAKPKKAAPLLLEPTSSISSYPEPSPGIFDGITFVFTGVMDDLSRDDAIDYVKNVGGRVTSAVSGKTNYLVIGTILEDGREVCEGSKYKKAKASDGKTIILNGEGELYMLAKMMDEKQGKTKERADSGNTDGDGDATLGNNDAAHSNRQTKSSVANPYAKTASTGTKVVNPYAKAATSSKVTNPYARAAKTTMANPYAKTSSTSTASSASKPPSCQGGGRADIKDPNALWADKYAPNNTRMILGNGDAVGKLRKWLATWEQEFNKPVKGKKRSLTQKFGPKKAALLSGPPGIGKTTTAVLVAEEAGRQLLELNASDARSKNTLSSLLGGVIGSHVISFDDKGKKGHKTDIKKRCIIMDEVDGMGAGDRGGMRELIEMIKGSKVPIICICNDRQSQKVKSLAEYCLDLRFRRPVKTVIARRAIEVGRQEGMEIEYNAAEAVAESCGNDIRQVLNCLQMWANKKHESSDQKTDMTYKDFKSRNSLINKDEMLRVSIFDAAKSIIQGRHGLAQADAEAERSHLFKRTDAFFVDYAIMGLLVHQNYLKVGIQPFQQAKVKYDTEAEYKALENMLEASESMSDFALAEHGVRSGDQNWGLLPFCSALTTKCGYHIGGEMGGLLPGFPEFSSWLGKNSSRSKKDRLLQELSHHMNYKISADKVELRTGYLPVIQERFTSLLMNKKEGAKATEAIEFMDEYGLDRDDVFETLDEFNLDSNAKKLSSLDSKTKASFTREYNKGSHKSQALVDELGAPTKKRKKTSTHDGEGDGSEDGSDDDDEEMNEEDIQKLFKKKGKRGKNENAKKTGKKKK